MSTPLITLEGLRKAFPLRQGLGGKKLMVRAINDVSLSIEKGEVLGLVGETGSGKSTLARLILNLVRADMGTIRFEGKPIQDARGSDLKALRKKMQLIFQDPRAALDPRMRLGQSMAGPLAQNGVKSRAEREQTIARTLEAVGLDASFAQRYPSECSGGQLHRVVLARALALGPQFLACDEPTSSLDASTRAQVLNLFVALKRELNLTMLMISHDLHVIRFLSDRIAVMYLGRIVEIGPSEAIFANPRHPYTRQLVAASSVKEGDVVPLLQGDPPSPINPPSGCAFRTRCPLARQQCTELPALEAVGPRQSAACFFWREDLPMEAPAAT